MRKWHYWLSRLLIVVIIILLANWLDKQNDEYFGFMNAVWVGPLVIILIYFAVNLWPTDRKGRNNETLKMTGSSVLKWVVVSVALIAMLLWVFKLS